MGPLPQPKHGLLIAIEGIDGAGKSSVARILSNRIKQDYPEQTLLLAKEPGTTPLGRTMYQAIHELPVSSMTAELFMFAAARAELVETVLKPTLAQGVTVIMDRFAASTLAYQAEREVTMDLIRTVNRAALQGLEPTLSVLLDGPVEKLLARKTGDEEPRKSVPGYQAYLERVAARYREIALTENEDYHRRQEREKVAGQKDNPRSIAPWLWIESLYCTPEQAGSVILEKLRPLLEE